MLEDFRQAFEVDDGELVDAREADEQAQAGRVEGDAPGVGGAIHHLIQEHGGGDFVRWHVDDGEGVGVDPAAVELGGGQVEAAEGMDDVGGAAVAADGDAAGVGGAERQADGGFGFERLEVDDGDLGGGVGGGGGGGGNQVADEGERLVRGDGHGGGLAADGDAGLGGAGGEVDDGELVEAPIGGEQELAAGHDGESARVAAGVEAAGDGAAGGSISAMRLVPDSAAKRRLPSADHANPAGAPASFTVRRIARLAGSMSTTEGVVASVTASVLPSGENAVSRAEWTSAAAAA